jgi:hypothetical protein
VYKLGWCSFYIIIEAKKKKKKKKKSYDAFFSSNQGGGAASQDQCSVSFDSEEDKYPIFFDTETS